MPNAKDPFEIDAGIEDIPVVKAPVQGINKVANSGTKYAQKQAKALTKAFVSQLYGTSSQTATDDDQQTPAIKSDPVAAAKKTISTPVYFAQSSKKAASDPAAAVAKTPEEQEQLEETRRLLFQHKQDYFDKDLGRLGNLEEDMQKEAQQRKQAEQEKAQAEEEEKKRKKEEEEKQQNQKLAVPQGKVRGQPPGVLKRSQTKAENKTGFSG